MCGWWSQGSCVTYLVGSSQAERPAGEGGSREEGMMKVTISPNLGLHNHTQGA